MNGSQLLYKISNLKYSISKKEIEYSNAVKAKDQVYILQHREALALLKEDLAATVEAFNAVPEPVVNQPLPKKKTKRWQNFFNVRTWRKV